MATLLASLLVLLTTLTSLVSAVPQKHVGMLSSRKYSSRTNHRALKLSELKGELNGETIAVLLVKKRGSLGEWTPRPFQKFGVDALIAPSSDRDNLMVEVTTQGETLSPTSQITAAQFIELSFQGTKNGKECLPEHESKLFQCVETSWFNFMNEQESQRAPRTCDGMWEEITHCYALHGASKCHSAYRSIAAELVANEAAMLDWCEEPHGTPPSTPPPTTGSPDTSPPATTVAPADGTRLLSEARKIADGPILSAASRGSVLALAVLSLVLVGLWL